MRLFPLRSAPLTRFALLISPYTTSPIYSILLMLAFQGSTAPTVKGKDVLQAELEST